MTPLSPDELFTPGELARAAGVSPFDVEALVDVGVIPSVQAPGGARFILRSDAVRAGRALALGVPLTDGWTPESPADLFDAPQGGPHAARGPFAVSSAVHAAVAAALVVVASLGIGQAAAPPASAATDEVRLVYLSLPGPGGGGGGGGLRQPRPAARAERTGSHHLDSPVPVKLPEVVAPPRREPNPPAPLPEVQAPVVSIGADPRDTAGVPQNAPATAASHGQGEGGGTGTGAGTGAGEGHGAGIGPGEDQGIGGGPYRPGSGITPPRLLRQVRPDYTEQARARGIQGEVVMEVVVRRDGSVGDVRVLQGLGYGLDQRAIDAVRRWEFAPGRRLGTPVDVMVEVAMEFRIR